MANFFLRGIDADVFRQARARCLLEGLRLPDVISELLHKWLQQKTRSKPHIADK